MSAWIQGEERNSWVRTLGGERKYAQSVLQIETLILNLSFSSV
jgi:hypothetical protein